MTRPMPGPRGCECLTCEGCAEERHEGLMREGEPCPACHVHAGPSYSEEKRLTDAECAAEYWRVQAEALHFDLQCKMGRWLDAERRLEVIKRFATTPHALEDEE